MQQSADGDLLLVATGERANGLGRCACAHAQVSHPGASTRHLRTHVEHTQPRQGHEGPAGAEVVGDGHGESQPFTLAILAQVAEAIAHLTVRAQHRGIRGVKMVRDGAAGGGVEGEQRAHELRAP